MPLNEYVIPEPEKELVTRRGRFSEPLETLDGELYYVEGGDIYALGESLEIKGANIPSSDMITEFIIKHSEKAKNSGGYMLSSTFLKVQGDTVNVRHGFHGRTSSFQLHLDVLDHERLYPVLMNEKYRQLVEYILGLPEEFVRDWRLKRALEYSEIHSTAMEDSVYIVTRKWPFSIDVSPIDLASGYVRAIYAAKKTLQTKEKPPEVLTDVDEKYPENVALSEEESSLQVAEDARGTEDYEQKIEILLPELNLTDFPEFEAWLKENPNPTPMRYASEFFESFSTCYSQGDGSPLYSLSKHMGEAVETLSKGHFSFGLKRKREKAKRYAIGKATGILYMERGLGMIDPEPEISGSVHTALHTALERFPNDNKLADKLRSILPISREIDIAAHRDLGEAFVESGYDLELAKWEIFGRIASGFYGRNLQEYARHSRYIGSTWKVF